MTQIEILNAKQQQMQKKFEHQQSILRNLQDNAQMNDKLLQDSEKAVDELTKEKIELKADLALLNDRVQNSV
jgi:hypothetical protein